LQLQFAKSDYKNAENIIVSSKIAIKIETILNAKYFG
jgi:hypothetical protein